MVEKSYERASAVNGATFFGVDDVIGPADSRHWAVRGLRSLPSIRPGPAGGGPTSASGSTVERY